MIVNNSKTKLPTACGYMNIEVNVTCPHCDQLINLLDSSETNGDEHNDCGDILKQTCPSDKNWGDGCQSLEVDDVVCGECKGEFKVRGVEW